MTRRAPIVTIVCMETIHANWYEHPRLYDIAFGWDPSTEVDFLDAAFERFAHGEVKRIYEPFCGTGRIAIELARRGYRVTAVDLVPAAIEYARLRAREAGVEVELTLGDACAFMPHQPVDAIVTLIDSFRLLASAEVAARAAQQFASGLRFGGLLVIGIDIGEKPPLETHQEHWTLERAGTRVETRVFATGLPGKTPGTSIARSILRVTEPGGREYELVTDEEMRDYTMGSFRAQFETNADFEFLTLTSRKYDLDRPIEPTPDHCGDIVAVFRRRG